VYLDVLHRDWFGARHNGRHLGLYLRYSHQRERDHHRPEYAFHRRLISVPSQSSTAKNRSFAVQSGSAVSRRKVLPGPYLRSTSTTRIEYAGIVDFTGTMRSGSVMVSVAQAVFAFSVWMRVVRLAGS
jgi:hypothetical protein